jgi:hypothetical protein
MPDEIFDGGLVQTPPSDWRPRENPPDAVRRGTDDLVRVSTDDPNMSFETADGRRYTTRDGWTTMPAKDAQKLVGAVPGVEIRPPSSQGIGPGSRVNCRPRHEYFGSADCGCDECKAGLVEGVMK